MDYRKEYEKWLASPALSEDERAELRALEGNDKEIKARFYGPLEFGTAGLRGTMYTGLHNMNRHVIRWATQGFANVIRAEGTEAMKKGVAVCMDCRNHSAEFARETACVMAANGIHVRLFESLRPTPELSFAVREYGCQAGVNVTAKPHFSSKKNVGKLVSSSPAPGTVLSSGESVTLYYGVGADKVQEATVGQSNAPYFYASELNDTVTGTYCKSAVTDVAKDCITLAQDENGSVYRVTAKDTGTSSDEHSNDILTMCFPFADGNAGDIGTCSYGGSQLPAGEGGMAKRLIANQWGAFDFGELGGSPSCGTAMFSPYDEGCNASKQVVQDSHDMSGATFDMHDFYVFFASGANLDAIEKSGYFDDSALAAAKKGSKPDTSRPFILARDASQYDTTSVPYNKAPVPSGQTLVQDPFVPGVGEFSASVKFNPAPTDANAYYLVESGQPDWQSLPDCDANGKVSEAAAQEQGFWRQVKGKYIFSVGAGAWSTIMTVNADGSFSADYHDSDLGVTGDGYPNGSRSIASGTGKFNYSKRNDDGSFSMTCDQKAFHQNGTVGDVTIKDGVRIETVDGIYGLTPCGTFTVYPAGYATSALSDDVKGWMYGVVGGSLPATLTGPLIVNDRGTFAFIYDQN